VRNTVRLLIQRRSTAVEYGIHAHATRTVHMSNG